MGDRYDKLVMPDFETCEFTFDELCPHIGDMLRGNPQEPWEMAELASFALGVLEKVTAQERAPFMEKVGELLEHSSNWRIHISVFKVLAVCNTEERRPFVRSVVQLLHWYNSYGSDMSSFTMMSVRWAWCTQVFESSRRCKFTFDELCPHLGTMLRCNPESTGEMDHLVIFALDVLEKATAQERAPFMEAVGELLKHSSSEIHGAVCKVLAVCATQEQNLPAL